MSWGHFPPSWVLDGNELKAFRAGATTGQHIAALKCYLAIAGVVNFTTKAADVSLTALEDITGCSRPMVIRGVRVLADRHLVTVDASNLTHRYTLDRFDDALKPRFSKVPELVSTQLCELPNRGQTALSAIKILILLLTLRDNYSNRAMVRHDKIRSYCGMQTRHVRPGIDHLISHRLIHVDEAKSARPGHPANVYRLLGDFSRRNSATVPPGVSAHMSPQTHTESDVDLSP